MQDMYKEERMEMQALTQNYVEKLIKLWARIFDHDMCKENLRKLLDHAGIFYDELLAESKEKRKYIETEITYLREEAETLCRVLKTDFEFPELSEDKPLLFLQAEMDTSLQKLRECLRKRREEMCELLFQQETLCDELGETPQPLSEDPLPTAEEIYNFRLYLEQLGEERVKRLNQLSNMRREIKGFLQVLDLEINTETEDRLLNHREIKLNAETFESLQRMHDQFGGQVREVSESIDTMRKKLDGLWDRLNISYNTRSKFTRITDINQHAHDVIYKELQRCETLKSQNIKKFVKQVRDEIVLWWNKTLKSDMQRNRFSNFNNKCYTDDLLVLHEMELDDLKSFYTNNQEIFELYADRKLLWERMCALESLASDPGRYNNRGGQLLKEEKERKTIAKKLPTIEQKINKLVQEYEKREHAPFLVYGENILTVMAQEWEKKRQDKEKITSARKIANTPLSRSQLITSRSPISLKNASTLKRTPSSINLSTAPNMIGSSCKRKLNPGDKYAPVAKRSLLHVLNSPSAFPNSNTKMSTTKDGNLFKSPNKKTRVISTLLRRKSGRLSTNSRKKRSSNSKNIKGFPTSLKPPKIVVTENCGESSDQDYTSFEKSIEPTSRSSVIHSNTRQSSNASKKLAAIIESKKERLARLPDPRLATPSKIPRLPSAPSPANQVLRRKLTTKNLPIII